jgi:hypothetical protein
MNMGKLFSADDQVDESRRSFVLSSAAGLAASGAAVLAGLIERPSAAEAQGNGASLAPVNSVSTTNVTLAGLQTIDGVAGSVGQRVLLTGQSTASQDGVWQQQATAWTRPTDFASGSIADSGATVVALAGGTLYGGTMWLLTNTDTVTIDTTNETWARTDSDAVHLAGPETITGPKTAQAASDTSTPFTIQRHSATQSADVFKILDETSFEKAGFNANGVLVGAQKSTTENPHQVWRVNFADAGRGPFSASMNSGLFGSTYDNTIAMGYNTANEVPTEPSCGWDIETDYWDGANHNVEFHIAYTPAQSGGVGSARRMFSTQVDRGTSLVNGTFVSANPFFVLANDGRAALNLLTNGAADLQLNAADGSHNTAVRFQEALVDKWLLYHAGTASDPSLDLLDGRNGNRQHVQWISGSSSATAATIFNSMVQTGPLLKIDVWDDIHLSRANGGVLQIDNGAATGNNPAVRIQKATGSGVPSLILGADSKQALLGFYSYWDAMQLTLEGIKFWQANIDSVPRFAVGNIGETLFSTQATFHVVGNSNTLEHFKVTRYGSGVTRALAVFEDEAHNPLWAILPGGQIEFAAAANEATGSGSAALGTNCPATRPTAPYTWEKVTTSDGSQGYIPVWK